MNILNNTLASNFYGSYVNSYSHSAIYISNGLMESNANVSNNTISNSRIGIFMNGIDNSIATTYNDFTKVSNNTINLSNNPLSGSGKHYYGIWMQTCYKALVSNNHLNRSVDGNFSPQNTGMLFKATRLMDVRDNDITNYDMGVRVVANCNSTDFRCNQVIDCSKGTYMQQASMTAQGSGTDPWDNTWDGIANYKIDGTLNLITNLGGILKWYHRGNLSSNFSPFPFAPLLVTKISPISNSTGPSACNNYCGTCPFVINDVNTLEKIINNQLNYDIYPDESRQLDKWYVYYVLKQYPNLKDSSTVLLNYYNNEDTLNTGRFSRVNDFINTEDYEAAASILTQITPENNVEYNMKKVLSIYIDTQLNDRELTGSEIDDLTAIAWQNAWYGGDAVFTARAILGLEVDDVLGNLRASQSDNSKGSTQYAAFPNPTSGIVNLNEKEYATILVKDASGRVVMNTIVKGGKVDLSSLENGFYIIQPITGSSTKINLIK